MTNPEAVSRSAKRDKTKRRTVWGATLRDPVLVLSLLWLTLVLIAAVFGASIAPHDPTAVDISNRLIHPFGSSGGTRYYLGTDDLGRDYLSRLILGARNSIIIGLLASAAATTFALVVGCLAAYLGGVVDQIVSRLIDLQLAFPALLFALIVLVSVGPSATSEILVLATGAWASIARYVRGLALEIKALPYLDSARTIGAPRWRIIVRHIVPNLLTEVVVLGTLRVATLMLTAAGLDFLGLGLQPPATSWGVLVASGRDFIQQSWWLTTLPGLAIFFTALSINIVATWVRTIREPNTRTLFTAKRKRRPKGRAAKQSPLDDGRAILTDGGSADGIIAVESPPSPQVSRGTS